MYQYQLFILREGLQLTHAHPEALHVIIGERTSQDHERQPLHAAHASKGTQALDHVSTQGSSRSSSSNLHKA